VNQPKRICSVFVLARGSLNELETQGLISKELGYLDVQIENFCFINNPSRLLAGLHKRVSK